MTNRRRSFVLAFALAVAACGPSEPKIVVHADAPVVVDPKPDRPGFDPRSARLRAAGHEVARISGRTLVLHVDAALLSNEPSRYEDALVASLVSLARVLDATKKDDAEAFAFATKSLDEVVLRYAPLAKDPRAHFEADQKRLVVETSARNPSEIPYFPVSIAFLDAYDDATERALAGTTPRSDADIERSFRWLVRTRPGRGSVVVFRAASRASAESREERARDAEAEVRLAVLDLEARADAPPLRAEMRRWLVGELPRIEAAHRDQKKLALLPRDAKVFRADAAYDKFVEKRFWELSPKEQGALVDVLFARASLCRGDEATCAKGRPLAGVSRLDIGTKLLAEARDAGFVASRTAHPELVARVICPANRDPRGKPRETCNASFAALALATPEGRRRIVGEISRTRDPAFAEEIAATLGYADPDDVRAFLRATEGEPPIYRAIVRAILAAGLDRQRAALEDETRRAFASGTPELRAAALTVAAETRGSLHRHYADGYFERFEKEWGTTVDARLLGAFLEGAPARLSDVPKIWKAIDPKARTAFTGHLDRFLATPADALAEAHTVTLEAIVARLCEDGTKDDLAKVHAALGSSSKKSPEAARAVANALDDSSPGRCKKKAPVADLAR